MADVAMLDVESPELRREVSPQVKTFAEFDRALRATTSQLKQGESVGSVLVRASKQLIKGVQQKG